MTKECKSCDAPVDPNATHAGAGDCRAAQRKEIRRLRSEVDDLRGRLDEQGQMIRGGLKPQLLAPSGCAKP